MLNRYHIPKQMQLIIISLCFLFTRNQKHRLVKDFFRNFLKPFEKYEINMKYSFFFYS